MTHTTSRRPKKLEENLGVKLLNHSVHGVAPTEAGQELLQRARMILEQVHEAEEAIRARTRNPQGHVIFGLPATISAVLSVPLVVDMARDYPRVSLRIVEGMSGYLLDWLRNGQLDVCILHDVQRVPGVAIEPLFSEELVLVGCRRVDGRRRSVRFPDLLKLDLILPARHSGLRDMLDRMAIEHGTRRHPKVEIDAFTQMKALARAGIGYTILSRASVVDELERGELHAMRITSPSIARRMYLAGAAHRPLSSAAAATVALLKRIVAQFDGVHWTAAVE